jgi:hypothetical protein
MTESDWLAAADPTPMFTFLLERGGVSDRKLRLFAVACYQLVCDQPVDERSRQAVEVAEAFADGLATEEELEVARQLATYAMVSSTPGSKAYHAITIAEDVTRTDWTADVIAAHAGFLAYASGERHPIGTERRSRAVRERQRAARAEMQTAKGKEADLLRCLIGNPFRPSPTLAPAVLAWNGGTVPKLAAAIYEERAFDRLPVLADALEDAGCTDAEVLTHCRSGGEHVRGCWVVDLVLGKG